MADKEKWIVNGYRFETQRDAKLAETEVIKIQKLEEKIDHRNPHMLLMVYNKAIDNKLFKTPVGIGYLNSLRESVKGSPLIKEEVKPIPVNQIFNCDSRVLGVNVSTDAQKARIRKLEKSRFLSIAINVILVLLVCAMFYISQTGESPTVLNYENAIQNKYATWEEELNQREQVVREKERELSITK